MRNRVAEHGNANERIIYIFRHWYLIIGWNHDAEACVIWVNPRGPHVEARVDLAYLFGGITMASDN